MKQAKTIRRQLKRKRVRAHVSGSAARPRLSVYVSNQVVSCQLIDDQTGKTLGFVTTLKEKTVQSKPMVEQAAWVGEQIAVKAKAAKITTVVFDRGRHIYHGRVKALAEAARANGLTI